MRYQIKIRGLLDPSWSSQFNGLNITTVEEEDTPATLLTGPLPDQPALFGILDTIRDLNLVLVNVTILEEEDR